MYRNCDDHLGLHRPFKRPLPACNGNVRCRLCLVSSTSVRAVDILTGEFSGAAIWGYAVPGGKHDLLHINATDLIIDDLSIFECCS